MGTVQVRLTADIVGCSLPAEGGFLTAVRPATVRTLEVAVEPGPVALRGGGRGGLLLNSGRATVLFIGERATVLMTLTYTRV